MFVDTQTLVHEAAKKISKEGCGILTCPEYLLGRAEPKYLLVVYVFLISLVIIAANIAMSLVMYMTLTKEYVSQTLALDDSRFKRMVRFKTAIQSCGVLLLIC